MRPDGGKRQGEGNRAALVLLFAMPIPSTCLLTPAVCGVADGWSGNGIALFCPTSLTDAGLHPLVVLLEHTSGDVSLAGLI